MYNLIKLYLYLISESNTCLIYKEDESIIKSKEFLLFTQG